MIIIYHINNKKMITGYIYIICKNGLKECYIGSTIDLEQRKKKHKNSCNSQNNPYHNYKVYQFIRANGGWNEWGFGIIEKYDCDNETELRIREQYYMDINKEYLLNERNAYVSQEEYKDYQKKYYEEYNKINKNKKREYDKIRRQKNRKQITQYQRERRQKQKQQQQQQQQQQDQKE